MGKSHTDSATHRARAHRQIKFHVTNNIIHSPSISHTHDCRFRQPWRPTFRFSLYSDISVHVNLCMNCDHIQLWSQREAPTARHDCRDREATVTDKCTTALRKTGAHSCVYTTIHTN